ncbi:MAG: CopG family transcriptional regulator [Actinobacteria bacterium]|nr:CopG family transcriptional regulator [Actinomycetota bacterium]
MARTQTMVQLNERLVRVLDGIARRRNLSRSALIREIIDNYLATTEELKIGAQIAAGYQKIPPATPDEWGDLAALMDRSTADLLQRLDAEERRQGNDPW